MRLDEFSHPSENAMKPDKETLRHLYEDDGLTIKEIAKKVGIHWHTVRSRMGKYGIPVRSRSEAGQLNATKLEVDEELVRSLYENERLSIEAIATRLGVSFCVVRGRLLAAGVTLRPAGSGLEHQGREQPTKEDLAHYVHVEHLPIEEIAAMYGITGCGISRRLDKLGIPRPEFRVTMYRGNVPSPPTENELRALVAEMVPLEEIAERFGVYRGLVSRLCDKYGITKRPGGMSEEYYTCKDGHLVKSRYEQRVDNWLFDNLVAHEYEPKLEFNRRFKSDFLANGWFIEIWGMGKRDKAYMDRRRRKTQYYVSRGLPLIQIEPQDFARDRKTWTTKLQACRKEPPESPWLPLQFDSA